MGGGGFSPKAIFSTFCHPNAARNRAATARFRIFGPSPLPRLAFTNATPHYHHYLIRATVPPFPTDIYPHPRRRARNRTPAAPFRHFAFEPLLPPRVCQRNTSTSPPPHLRDRTTSLH